MVVVVVVVLVVVLVVAPEPQNMKHNEYFAILRDDSSFSRTLIFFLTISLLTLSLLCLF